MSTATLKIRTVKPKFEFLNSKPCPERSEGTLESLNTNDQNVIVFNLGHWNFDIVYNLGFVI
jgi:hypothetical protein